jgi:hypothetical protein
MAENDTPAQSTSGENRPVRRMGGFRKTLSQAREQSSRHASAWFFSALATVILPFIARAMGVDLTFVPFIHEGLLRSGIDGAICLGIAYIILFGCLLALGLARSWGLRLNLWIALGSLGAVLMLVGIGGYLWDLSRGPIIWDWNFRWINYSYLKSNNRIDISRFEIVGENRWDDPIVVSSAFVRSDITNNTINMVLNIWSDEGDTPRWAIATSNVIPAKGRFLLYGKLNPEPNRYDGLQDPEFKKQFGQFSFFFNSNLVKRFYPNDVDKLIRKMFEDSTTKSK